MTATDARIRFGEVMRRVVEQGERVIVERVNKPLVVILSMSTYKQMKAAQQRESWQDALARVIEVGTRIRARREGQPLTPPDEIIHQMREERDAQLANLC